MLDALVLNSVAYEFAQDTVNTDQAYFDMHVCMCGSYGGCLGGCLGCIACMGFKSLLNCYSQGWI